jgi:hypothetical protein
MERRTFLAGAAAAATGLGVKSALADTLPALPLGSGGQKGRSIFGTIAA